jgi:hypothetical protein
MTFSKVKANRIVNIAAERATDKLCLQLTIYFYGFMLSNAQRPIAVHFTSGPTVLAGTVLP